MQILGSNGQPVSDPSASAASPGQPDAAPGAAGDLIKDGTDQSFMADVVEASRQVPVLVDFWAPWCGPCRQLTPVLEAAVAKAGGAVKLVKVNIDENPGVAGQLRIQSIPAVIAFRDGQPADGFMGALPESQVREFIKRLSGDGAGAEELAALLERAEASLKAGDLGGAAQDFAVVMQNDPDNMVAVAGMAKVQMAGGEPEQARQLIDSVPENKKSDPAILAIRAALELSSEAQGAGDPATLEAAAHAAPGDAGAQYELARALIGAGDLAAASDALLASIAADQDWNEQAARQLLLRVFDAAGPSSAIARDGRRKLSSILFS
ncbi:MAG: thioredoxin [Pseudomonadota bacterium]